MLKPQQGYSKSTTFIIPLLRIRSLSGLFSVGVVLSSSLYYGIHQAANFIKQHEQPAQIELYRFSRAEYEQLKPGMSLTEVRSIILYRGVEVSRSATVATFVWQNPDGYKITAVFENDKLKSKEQSGLK